MIQTLYEDVKVQNTLSNENCKWTFITPRAPHQGGFYERMVGTVKSALRKSIFRKRINQDELVTIIAEVERRVNNRPLTYVDSTTVDTIETITPSHLLYVDRLNSLPVTMDRDYLNDSDFMIDHKVCNARFHYLTNIIHIFQEQWEKEYLHSLREKHRCKTDPNRPFHTQIKVGDIVLVHNDTHRCLWKLAKVIQLMPSNDGLVRVVKLKTNNGETTRSVDRLYPLEVSTPIQNEIVEIPEDTCNSVNNESLAVPVNEPARPVRSAAKKSRESLKQLIQRDDL